MTTPEDETIHQFLNSKGWSKWTKPKAKETNVKKPKGHQDNSEEAVLKKKAALSEQKRKAIRESVELQLTAIHSKLSQPISTKKKKRIHHGPAKLKSELYQQFTKRFSEQVFPHCRRGSDAYRMGRDNGILLGSLYRDYHTAEALELLPNKEEYLVSLKEEIQTCNTEKELMVAALPEKKRRDYIRGFANGRKLADQQPKLMDAENMNRLLARLWKHMPMVLTRFGSVTEIFAWLYARPAKDDRDFPAFKVLCHKLGIRLRPRGRPPKL